MTDVPKFKCCAIRFAPSSEGTMPRVQVDEIALLISDLRMAWRRPPLVAESGVRKAGERQMALDLHLKKVGAQLPLLPTHAFKDF